MQTETFDPRTFPAGFAGFWAGLREQRISFPHCQDCDRCHWYPMARCPHCLSERLDWRPVAGAGTLWSWTEVLRTMADDMPAPYIVGLVEFSEVPGIRLITNIVEGRAADLRFGMALEPVFVVAGLAMPRVHFRPLSDEASHV